MSHLASFIRYQRKKLKLTQEDLAAKAGVGIRFIRELEQGKETVQLDKVNQVLDLFGFNLSAEKQHIDAYDIFWNYFNTPVKISLKNKTVKHGIIIKEIIDPQDRKITAWEFISNNNAVNYQQKQDNALIEILSHDDIQTIEEQP